MGAFSSITLLYYYSTCCFCVQCLQLYSELHDSGDGVRFIHLVIQMKKEGKREGKKEERMKNDQDLKSKVSQSAKNK